MIPVNETNDTTRSFYAVSYNCYSRSGVCINSKLLVQAADEASAKSEAEKILASRGKRFAKAINAFRVDE